MAKPNQMEIMPIIYVESVEEIREFYVDKLGFGHAMGVLGKDGKLDFVNLVLDGAKLMFSRPHEDREGVKKSHNAMRALDIYLEVADIDAYYQQLKQRGVEMDSEPETQWWGDRILNVIDPYGYQILFYQTVAEFTPPKGTTVV